MSNKIKHYNAIKKVCFYLSASICVVILSGCSGNLSKQNVGAGVGAVAGGLIGSTFGGGSGKLVSTVVGAGAGAIAGSYIGSEMDNS